MGILLAASCVEDEQAQVEEAVDDPVVAYDEGEVCPPYLNATATCSVVANNCSTANEQCKQDLLSQCNTSCSIGCANESVQRQQVCVCQSGTPFQL